MNDIQFAGMGAYLYGALYLASVTAAGLALGNPFTWKLSIASAGFAYIAQYLVAFTIANRAFSTAAYTFIFISAFTGIVAGFSLLF